MLTPRAGRCLRQFIVQLSPMGCLPAFLLPAFSCTPNVRPFSTSTPCASRVGGATLSLPPEVNMTVLAPPTPKNKNRVGRSEPVATVQVEGPLGTDQSNPQDLIQVLTVRHRQDVNAATAVHGHRARCCSQKSLVEGSGSGDKATTGDVGCATNTLPESNLSADINQGRLALTSRTTSSASQKVIPPSCV